MQLWLVHQTVGGLVCERNFLASTVQTATPYGLGVLIVRTLGGRGLAWFGHTYIALKRERNKLAHYNGSMSENARDLHGLKRVVCFVFICIYELFHHT